MRATQKHDIRNNNNNKQQPYAGATVAHHKYTMLGV